MAYGDARANRADIPPKSTSPERDIVSPELLEKIRELVILSDLQALSIDDPYFDSVPVAKKNKDRAYVKATLERIAQSGATNEERVLADIATALEFVFVERINKSGWLGDVLAAHATKVDDLRNGIDIYLKKIGVSMDVTYTRDSKGLTDKVRSIENFLLRRGAFANLEYYKALDSSEEQVTSLKVPKVIVGIMRSKALEVISNYLRGEVGSQDSMTGLVILNQIIMQLRHFGYYSRKLGLNGNKAAEEAVPKYEQSLSQVKALWDAKLVSLRLDKVEDKVKALVNQDPMTQFLRETLDAQLPIE